MCKIIAIANQKGGVAKTTTTINLGVGLSKVGKRVMLIDADPQGHLTMGLGFPKNLRVTLKTMMENIIMGLEFDPREAILHHEEGIDVIPSNKLLSGMDMSLFTVEDREKVLKEYLELLENDYDYILIDCMPSLGMMTINALSAADSVLIPVQPQYYAADGLMELLKVVKGIHQRFNPDLQIEGILFTMDSSHYNNSKRNKQAVRDAYGAEIRIFDQTIPRTEALAETASEGVSIFSYYAKGKGAYSYAKNIDIPEQDDCFNDIRKEYSDMLKMQLSKGNNGLVKTKYITFSIKADNLRNAKSRLERIEASVLNNFKVMGAMAEPLNGVERLKILHDVMNMDTKESFHFHYGMVAKTGLQTKDFIAPTGFDFRNDSYFRMGQTFGCVSYLQITSPELTDKLLADLLDLEENLIINMHLRPIDPKAAIKSLKSTLSNIQKMKIEEQKKAVRSGYDMDIIPTDISTYGEDVEGLLNEIQSRNEKLFELTFLLMNTADNKRKLDNIVYQTAGIAQKYNCNIRRLQYQQEQGLVASLPLGMNQTGIQRIMTTTSTAIFVPFTTQELFQGGEALYYGLNALSNNLIMVDRKRLKTPNGLILGTPGSGKSFATKREILNVFLITDDDIIICDPEGEYFPLVNALNGEVIKISAKSNDYINPMEVNLDVIYHPEKYRINGDVEDIDTIIADKAEFITSFCEVIMKKPQNAELNGDEVSMIDLCVKDIYKKYLYNDPKPENMPTLQDFYERLNFYARIRMEGLYLRQIFQSMAATM